MNFRIAGALALLGWTAVAHADPLAGALVTCLIEPSAIVAAASPVAGVVGRVFRERGDPVRKGERLFELESSVEEATLQTVSARHRFIQGKWQRNQALIRENVLSEHERDELRHEFEMAESTLAEAKAALARRTVHATIDGVVIERLISPGEYVRENPVMRIATVDPLRADLTVRAESHGRVRPGRSIRVGVGPGHPTLAGRVVMVDPHIDAASGTFTVRAEIANPGGRVPAGLLCRLVP